MITVSNKHVIITACVAIFGVLSHWPVWSQGMSAVGVNTSLYWAGIGYLLLNDGKVKETRGNWPWLVPICAISLSFALFENPWLKPISLFTLPLAIGFFYISSRLSHSTSLYWDKPLLCFLYKRLCSPIHYLFSALHTTVNKLTPSNASHHYQTYKSVIVGIGLLVPISLVIIIVLVSADSNFEAIVYGAFNHLFSHINSILLAKIALSFIATIVLIALIYGWSEKTYYEQTLLETQRDNIIASIVMGGILVIYSVFLYLQLGYLFLDILPDDFEKTERIVKSGFWQLCFLSVFNALLFLFYYKKTQFPAQLILRVFILSSGLLLLSAGWRMALYVYWYGLSYEKFFASYTVVYALGIFVVLLVCSLFKTRKNILKWVFFSALWCYALVSVAPVEKIIFNINKSLQVMPNSHVDMNELQNLSVDIMAQVRQDIAKSELESLTITSGDGYRYGWPAWVEHREDTYCSRPWYMMNVSAMVNCRADH